jgi:membrane protein required for colicin V production
VNQGVGLVDGLMLALLLVSVIVGLVRGLVYEVLSLAGWVVAYFGAHWVAPWLAPLLPVGEPGSGVQRAAAFLAAFFAILIVWTLLAKVVRLLVHATPLTLVDRVGGGAFGVLRGALVLMAVATLVAFTPAAQSSLWQASVGARWLTGAVHALWPALPADVRHWLPDATRI